MFILKKEHPPGLYVPLSALFLVLSQLAQSMAISNPKLCANFDSFGCLIGKRLPALNLRMAVKIGNGAFLFLLVLIWSNSLCSNAYSKTS